MRRLDDDGERAAERGQALEDAHAVEFRHHEIEDHQMEAIAVGAGEHLDRRAPVVQRHRAVAEPHGGCLQQPALHGIVVDDENTRRHRRPVLRPSRSPDAAHPGLATEGMIAAVP